MLVNRSEYVACSLNLVGAPYLWCAKGQEMGIIENGRIVRWEPTPKDERGRPVVAMDCSGAITYPLKKMLGPDLRKSHNTDALWNELPRTDYPEPGDLALYAAEGAGPNDMEHVMMVVAKVGHLYIVAGASGGKHTTTTLDVAAARRACYKVKPSHLYRPGFRGFRSMSKFLG